MTHTDPTIPVHWMDRDQAYSDMPEFRPEDPDFQLTIATALGVATKFHVVCEGAAAGPSEDGVSIISVVVTSEGPVCPARCIRRYRVEDTKHITLVTAIACRWMLETALTEVAMEVLY